MRNSNAIKNLSMALEALSRIQQVGSHYYDVEKLLGKAIKEDLEDKPLTEQPTTATTSDDEIPF